MQASESEDNLPKAGRLIEGEEDVLGVKGRTSRKATVVLPLYCQRPPSRRRTARCRSSSELSARLSAKIPAEIHRAYVAPFHFAQTYHSRDRGGWIEPLCCRKGRRVPVFPRLRGELKSVREAQGRYNKKCRVWTIKSNHPFLRSDDGRYLASEVASIKRCERRAGKSANRSDKGAAAFQAYIERLSCSDEERNEHIDSDSQGLISLGNLGKTPEERRRQIEEILRVEKRHDARIQTRIVIEAPHWISSSERRLIAEEFGKLFEDCGLRYWITLHLPDSKGDQRNFHFHVMYHDRPMYHGVKFLTRSDGQLETVQTGLTFTPTKNRLFCGPDWIRFLRKSYADIVNNVLLARMERERRMPPYFYYAGSYAELGIDCKPQSHLGPRQTAILRKGQLPSLEQKNLDLQYESLAERERIAVERANAAIERLFDRYLADKIGKKSDNSHSDVAHEILAALINGISEINECRMDPDPTERVLELLNAHNLDPEQLTIPARPGRSEGSLELLLNGAHICLLHRLEVMSAYYDALASDEPLLPMSAQLRPSEKSGARLYVPPGDAAIAREFGAWAPLGAGGWLIRPEIPEKFKQRLTELFGTPEAHLHSLADRRAMPRLRMYRPIDRAPLVRIIFDSSEQMTRTTDGAQRPVDTERDVGRDAVVPSESQPKLQLILDPSAQTQAVNEGMNVSVASKHEVAAEKAKATEVKHNLPQVQSAEKSQPVARDTSKTASKQNRQKGKASKKRPATKRTSMTVKKARGDGKSGERISEPPVEYPEPRKRLPLDVIYGMDGKLRKNQARLPVRYGSILNLLEAQLSLAPWIKEVCPSKFVNRTWDDRLNIGHAFEICIDPQSGWIVREKEGYRPVDSGGFFGGWRKQLPRQYWREVLEFMVRRSALCLGGAETRRQIEALGFKVPEPQQGYFHIETRRGEIWIREDGGAFAYEGSDSSIKQLFDALAGARSALANFALNDSSEPLAYARRALNLHENAFDVLRAYGEKIASHIVNRATADPQYQSEEKRPLEHSPKLSHDERMEKEREEAEALERERIAAIHRDFQNARANARQNAAAVSAVQPQRERSADRAPVSRLTDDQRRGLEFGDLYRRTYKQSGEQTLCEMLERRSKSDLKLVFDGLTMYKDGRALDYFGRKIYPTPEDVAIAAAIVKLISTRIAEIDGQIGNSSLPPTKGGKRGGQEI